MTAPTQADRLANRIGQIVSQYEVRCAQLEGQLAEALELCHQLREEIARLRDKADTYVDEGADLPKMG